jgi:hypothetical protein
VPSPASSRASGNGGPRLVGGAESPVVSDCGSCGMRSLALKTYLKFASMG